MAEHRHGERCRNMSFGTPQLSEQARALLASSPPFTMDTTEARRSSRAFMLANSGPREHVATVREVDASGVRARLYEPDDAKDAVLVWLHGGAWMSGDLDCYDGMVRALANRAGCSVLSVDYRLAPEHQFPAPLVDCWNATLWAARRYERIALGGDSAGGNLAAAVCDKARSNLLSITFQLLVYPVLDWRPDSASYNEYRRRYDDLPGFPSFGTNAQNAIRHIWDVYVPDEANRVTVGASPLRAATFSGLPPTLIVNAEHDILRGESEEYARQLLQAEVPVTVLTYEGQVHGFYPLPGTLDDSMRAIVRSADALRDAFEGIPFNSSPAVEEDT
jgi:acetyl esterase